MGQSEVIHLMEKKGGWFCANRIAEKLKTSSNVVRRALMILYYHGEVSRKQCPNSPHHLKYIYRLK